MNTRPPLLPADIPTTVTRALAEDIGRGDLSAALVPRHTTANATIITREPTILCGSPWATEVFRQLDPTVEIDWQSQEGADVEAGQTLCTLHGPAQALLTGERCALNFLQTLSGTATHARRYADAVANTGCVVLDTRKTIPGLRSAQKYASALGGCRNHRLGLDDGILIKENHITACGSIANAVASARDIAPVLTRIEVEVEDLEQVHQALAAGTDALLLDNFPLQQLREAVALCKGRASTEASGNIDLDTIAEVAATGVDFISTGAITKHLRAIDLSMRINYSGLPITP
jgi:nicotinate-nucleotide pyrophosphorylase (carboxylating)